METQESIDLSDVKQPYIIVNEKENNTPSERRNYRYVKKSSLYWIVCLTVVVAAILLTINGIIVYYIASGDTECTFVVPEGYVLSPKDKLQLQDQPKDDMQVSDQQKKHSPVYLPQRNDDMQVSDQTTTSETTETTSHDVTTTATRTSSECPNGWILKHRLSCYYISGDTRNWKSAFADCLVLGGYIVEINDTDENEFLVTEVKRLNGDNYWIGLTDKISEGSWVWSNSSTALNTGHYSNWNPGQPDNGGGSEHCAELIEEYSYSWNDDQCHRSHYYICERVLQ